MEDFVKAVGMAFVVVGGIAAVILAMCLLLWLAEIAWIEVSDKFRDICKAESLIFEYRREREEFLWWKNHVKGDICADDHD